MNKQLKWEIIKFIFNNEKEFQLHNSTVKNFREYIYTTKGEYLIGGEEVYKFIGNAIQLLTQP